ncbi:uncharacterized protein BDW47DRAFT_16561 [Aspergillus candidus]|uniref:Uncharacterized protein n=1 Tax=Aspergillus candidus TaxID=41067 RepID=A0A2I2FEW2_ASPCN|nr:hypothetical protein BDW47DRAFT_16561 [Aspergillus candidus]PLB39119.1 hypothetical protein BDW47DRAFT_16561 [Aspergillus candidus]
MVANNIAELWRQNPLTLSIELTAVGKQRMPQATHMVTAPSRTLRLRPRHRPIDLLSQPLPRHFPLTNLSSPLYLHFFRARSLSLSFFYSSCSFCFHGPSVIFPFFRG